jgi:hypothetical protein
MAWTEDDRAAVEQAMRDIIANKRVITLTTADRSESRQITKLDELRAILAQIDQAVTPKPRIFRTRYCKGL